MYKSGNKDSQVMRQIVGSDMKEPSDLTGGMLSVGPLVKEPPQTWPKSHAQQAHLRDVLQCMGKLAESKSGKATDVLTRPLSARALIQKQSPGIRSLTARTLPDVRSQSAKEKARPPGIREAKSGPAWSMDCSIA